MALGDELCALRRRRGAGALFPLGCLLLAGATAVLAGRRLGQGGLPLGAAVVWLLLAAAALALLIHTLFFALPAAGSGALPPCGHLRPLADRGVYALCRHPGVLWLGLFYGCLWAALGGADLGRACLLYTGLDVLYALWQDRRVFPRTIAGYGGYQGRTPFLIPTLQSMRACAATWRKTSVKGPGKKKGS